MPAFFFLSVHREILPPRRNPPLQPLPVYEQLDALKVTPLNFAAYFLSLHQFGAA